MYKNKSFNLNRLNDIPHAEKCQKKKKQKKKQVYYFAGGTMLLFEFS